MRVYCDFCEDAHFVMVLTKPPETKPCPVCNSDERFSMDDHPGEKEASDAPV